MKKLAGKEKKLSILLITDLYPVFAGQTQEDTSYALHNLVKYWVVHHQVLVLRPFIVPDVRRKNKNIRQGLVQIDGVDVLNWPVVKIPKLKYFIIRSLQNGLQLFDFEPDVIVAHLGFNLYFGYQLARFYSKPFIAGVHRGDFRFGFSMLSEAVLIKIFNSADVIACRSYALEKRFKGWLPQLINRCRVVYSGVEPSFILDDTAFQIKNDEFKQSDSFSFISVCSLVKLKNIDIVIKALSALNQQIKWNYLIVGDGPERVQLESQVKYYQLEKNITFTGALNQQQIKKKLYQSQIFIMVSSYETFGLAYLEAMAAGNLVIASKDEGIDGIIIDNENGFLCEPGDPMKLLRVIKDKIINQDKFVLTEMMQKSLATVNGFTELKAAENYLSIIEKVCGK
jgi:glycosyltransferase involved in cell wall biosynthesis